MTAGGEAQLEARTDGKPTGMHCRTVEPIYRGAKAGISGNSSRLKEKHLIREIQADEFCLDRPDAKTSAWYESKQ